MTDFKRRNDGECDVCRNWFYGQSKKRCDAHNAVPQRLDIPGYAMKADEDKIAHERRRIGRIARITFANMPLKRDYRYNRVAVTGQLANEAAKNLTLEEIAFAIDDFCFGGTVKRDGDNFEVIYAID